MTPPDAHSSPPSRTRVRIGWAIVAVVALAVAGSFLIESEEEADGGGGRERRATPVAVASVERGEITERRRYPGELDADAADVASFYPGRVEAVHVRVGDVVKAGQPLVEVDPVDAREQIARARAQAQAAAAEEKRAAVELAEAKTQLERFDQYRSEVSDADYDAQQARVQALGAAVAGAAAREAEANAGLQLLQKRIVESVIRAPFDGRIAERHVDPGAIVNATAPLVRVVATSPLRVRFEVPDHDIAGVSVGTALRVVTGEGDAADAGVAATVTGVGAEVDRERRVATVEAVIDAPPAGWLPGMFAQAIVDRRTIRDATVVPAVAVLSRLQPDGTIATGVLVADEGAARWVPVTVVAREDDRVAIQGAVAPGAQVLIAGHVDLAEGSPIQVAGAKVEG
jgi:RND family efflux transporter MFP subunit